MKNSVRPSRPEQRISISRRTLAGLLLGAAAMALVGAAALLAPSACRKSASTHTIRKERIEIVRAARGIFSEAITVPGKILPVNIVYLDAMEAGRVENIFVESGSLVKKGDKILRLANSNLLMDIMWRESELFESSNNMRNTRLSMEQFKLQLNRQLFDIENQLQQQRRVYERYTELDKGNLISRHQYELAKDQYEYLVKQKELTVESQKSELKFRQAQIEALEESLTRMQANLDVVKQRQENLTLARSRLRPADLADGRTRRVHLPGHPAGPDRPVGRVHGESQHRRAVHRPDQAQGPGRIRVRGANLPGGRQEDLPEVKDGKFEVDFEFMGEHPPGLKRGQTLHIQLTAVDPSDSLLLPRGDFVQATGGKWVYVLEDGNKSALRRRIQVGRQNPEVLEVIDGTA